MLCPHVDSALWDPGLRVCAYRVFRRGMDAVSTLFFHAEAMQTDLQMRIPP